MSQSRSFGYGSISQSSAPGYQGGSSDAERCKALSDKISSQIFAIGATVNSMEQCLKQLGTDRDSAQLRQRLHDIQLSANAATKETMMLLHQLCQANSLIADNRMYKLQWQRLTGEFEDIVQKYSTMQKKVADRVKTTSPPKAPSSNVPTSDLIGWGEAGADSNTQSGSSRQGGEKQLVLQVDSSDIDLELLREREQQIRQLESDILDVNQIFRELGMLVHEQGEVINTIEENVTVASDNVEEGRNQLRQAATYQMKSRKKMCCLIAILLVVVAVVVVIIVVAVKVH